MSLLSILSIQHLRHSLVPLKWVRTSYVIIFFIASFYWWVWHTVHSGDGFNEPNQQRYELNQKIVLGRMSWTFRGKYTLSTLFWWWRWTFFLEIMDQLWNIQDFFFINFVVWKPFRFFNFFFIFANLLFGCWNFNLSTKNGSSLYFHQIMNEKYLKLYKELIRNKVNEYFSFKKNHDFIDQFPVNWLKLIKNVERYPFNRLSKTLPLPTGRYIWKVFALQLKFISFFLSLFHFAFPFCHSLESVNPRM